MREFTFKTECLNYSNKELKEYIKNIKGIDDIKIDDDNDIVYIKYDENIISIKRIMLEFKSFLKILNMPSILNFNKHFKIETKNKEIIIKDTCCEYCLKSGIEDLILNEYIESVDIDFKNITYFNTKINVNYIKEKEQEIIKYINDLFN